MGHLDITLYGCAVEDIPHLVGPYLRDHFQHHCRPQTGLGLTLTLPFGDFVAIQIGDVGESDFFTPEPAQVNAFTVFTVEVGPYPPKALRDKEALNLIAHAPRKESIYFRACGGRLSP